MDASPIYAFAVGDSQTLFTHPCGCAFLRNASFGFLQSLKKAKRRSLTPDVFLMSGSAESFMISICQRIPPVFREVTGAVLSRLRCRH